MPPPNQFDPFWQLSLGNLLTGAAVLLAFLASRRESRRMHEENIQRMADMSSKVELMYDWFSRTVIGRERSR